ncbi:MAG: transcription repressor NadR [Clostridia bacterium]|jgi:transcriptional regulator of NAD metabolism|nr:transcription repressor NadR [Clostridia bacterium]
MSGEARRQQIQVILAENESPVTGGELARRFGVSRQVIVQDVALLRAQGHTILATPQGYLLSRDNPQPLHRRTFAVSHGAQELEQELNAIVDCGGRVIDVTVEHPLYGELRGLLMVSSRREVEEFITKLRTSGAAPLSLLTSGVHLHTVEALSPEVLDRIQEKLEALGFLVG